MFAFARIRSLEEPSQQTMLALAVLSLGLGWASWRFIEQPFRTVGPSKPLLASRRSVFLASDLSAAALLAFAVSGHVTKGFAGRSAMKAFAVLEFPREFGPYQDCTDPQFKLVKLNMCRIIPGPPPEAVVLGDSHADDKLYGFYRQDKSRR